jgi:hypothetical protein
MTINIWHPVNLFPQPTGMTCWSAAATMLIGNQSVGPGGARIATNGGLMSDFGNIRRFAYAYGLQMEPPQSWTVDGLAALLRRSPLWVAGQVPTGHAYVIAAMTGDGTPNGTTLTIYDPWPPNIGQIRQVPYGQWVSLFPMSTMYILHR